LIRSARPDDADEVARLAALMYRSLGLDFDENVWGTWRASAMQAVQARLGRDLTVVVVEDPDVPGHLLACGAGVISERLPNPSHADSRVGYVQWMSTEQQSRRQGLGRAVLQGLLAWFESEGVDNVELHASRDGVGLYRSESFWEGSTGLALRRRPWDPAPGR
jgi:ribosomal protein S18 acetylase RimI-like enzyme